MPISFIAAIASGRTYEGFVPAENTSNDRQPRGATILPHLASSRIASAQDQHTFLGCHGPLAPVACDGASHANRAVATPAPATERYKSRNIHRTMPLNVPVIDRASVTAGFAKEVDAVNQ